LQYPMPLPMTDWDHSTGCEDCVEACHAGDFALQDARAYLTDAKACDVRADCEASCLAEAIRWPSAVVFDDRPTLH